MKLFNKNAGNPLLLALIIPALLPLLLGWSFFTALALLTFWTVVAIWLNKGLWKWDSVYIIIAYLIIILGYSFPDFFNVAA